MVLVSTYDLCHTMYQSISLCYFVKLQIGAPRFFRAPKDSLVELCQQPGLLPLRVEVTTVGLNAEHGLIEKLQLRHRERMS
ncbi:MAG: hypothetical protein IJ559_09580 [Prevotella sp.]|nr:hypothetical protein [Prevotella sp.]